MQHKLTKSIAVFGLILILSSSCAIKEFQNIENESLNSLVNANDSYSYEKKEYSLFYDQGNHFVELFQKGYIQRAAKLYEDYHNTYFEKKSAFSKETMKQKYGEFLDEIALKLNESLQDKIKEASKIITKQYIWPLPEDEWIQVKNSMSEAKRVLDIYNTYYILTEDRYRNTEIRTLQNQLNELTNKLKDHVVVSFNTYNITNGIDFFERYPVEISDKKGVLSSNFDFIFNRLSDSSCEEIENFNSVYKKYLEKNINLVGNLYLNKFLNEKDLAGSTVNLVAILDALEKAKIKGFVINEVEGKQIKFVEATSKTLLDEGYIEFPAKVDIDLPFSHTACDLEMAFSESNDSDFVIIFDIAQASVKRRIKTREQITSKYLAGYKDVYNPKYKQVIVNLRQAERELASSENTNCGYGNWGAVACEVLKGIAVASLTNKMNIANQEYINTPEYIKEEIHENYQFSVSLVDVTKTLTVNYYILDRINKRYYKSSFDISEEKNFKVIYSLKDEDTRKGYHLSSYSSEEDILNFESSPVSVKLSSLIKDYVNNNDDTKGLITEENFRKELLEDKYFKLAEHKANKHSTLSLNDPRFNNVVVIINPLGAIGSGFYVEPNLVLTNYHVVEGAKFLEMKLHNGQETFGKVVKSDVRLDLALLKVETRNEPVSFYESNQIDLGEEVEAIGHPSGLEFSISRGIVSAIRKRKSVYDTGGKEVLFIQTDAAINPGNSGGPLFLGDKVVGVNNQKIVKDSVEGLGFAVHFSEVQNFLKETF